MKRLFLCSSFKDVSNIFLRFEKNVKNKKVTFINTASIVEDVNFYVDDAKSVFKELEIIVDEAEISQMSYLEIEKKLKNNDFIYISGGNTFFLLQELKNSGADKLIIEEINKGKIFIAESAGAIICCPNIEYISKMDDKSKATFLNDYNSLSLVDFYILPHLNSNFFKVQVNEIIEEYSSKINLVPISNFDAICVFDDKVEFICKHY